jgi:hypothetical protein
MVTDEDPATSYGHYFVKKHFGFKIESVYSKKGEGFYIDCRNRKLEKISF